MAEYKLTISSLGWLVSELTKMITSSPNIAYRVSIKQRKEKRSLSQNSLYWKWLGEVAKQQNVSKDPEIWHEIFKKYYCPEKLIEIPIVGIEPLRVKSTKKLDIGEMTFYLNRIENFCIDRGIRLTIPESSEYRQLMDRQND